MSEVKVLVIEDESSIRQILKIQLEAAGYSATAAGSGEEGLERLAADPPDLVLTDLMMPGMDGHEVCRRIKTHFRTAHIPVIMLTAKSDIGAKVQALDFGANDYITKPYERQEMLLRVRNLLSWSRSQREANPLTGLPGNVAIEKEITRRLEAPDPFLFLYVDLDNFKAYNDYYGYQKGDVAIRLLARILTEVIMEHGCPSDFVGHVGGDDFVVITTPDRTEDVGGIMTRRWDAESKGLFTADDLDAGFLRVRNRRGEMESFALMTLTVAAVPSSKYKISHLAQLNDLASELKRFGKSLKGSVVVYERRGDSGPILKTGTES